MKSGAPEGLAVPALQVASIITAKRHEHHVI